MAAFDVIVIGLGAMGSAAVDALQRRGLDVLGIDRYGPGHSNGSSHGRSRTLRLAPSENADQVPLMLRAWDLWRDLERRARETLLTVTGALDIGRGAGSELVGGVVKAATAHGVMYELLDREAIQRRFPVFDIPVAYTGVLQPEAGILRPEPILAAYHRLAGAAGARLHFGERVVGIEPKSERIDVVTDEGRYECGQVVLAAGAWNAKFVPDLVGVIRTTRQVTGWFWPRDPTAFSVGVLPVFAVDDGVMGTFRGVPAFEYGGAKIARQGHLNEFVDPDGLRLPVGERDVTILRSFLSRRMPLLDGEPVYTEGCIQTNLPEGRFLVDWLPQDSRILVTSVCNGHGFKFASVVGEIISDLVALGSTRHPVEGLTFSGLKPRNARRTT